MKPTLRNLTLTAHVAISVGRLGAVAPSETQHAQTDQEGC
jgi:hypothetical protein